MNQKDKNSFCLKTAFYVLVVNYTINPLNHYAVLRIVLNKESILKFKILGAYQNHNVYVFY